MWGSWDPTSSEYLACRSLQVAQVMQVRQPHEVSRRRAHELFGVEVRVEQLVDEMRELLGSHCLGH
jgi:hypothetical protein